MAPFKIFFKPQFDELETETFKEVWVRDVASGRKFDQRREGLMYRLFYEAQRAQYP